MEVPTDFYSFSYRRFRIFLWERNCYVVENVFESLITFLSCINSSVEALFWLRLLLCFFLSFVCSVILLSFYQRNFTNIEVHFSVQLTCDSACQPVIRITQIDRTSEDNQSIQQCVQIANLSFYCRVINFLTKISLIKIPV